MVCSCLGAIAFAQVSGSAKPVQGAILVRPGDISADDAPSEFFMMVGNVQADTGPGLSHFKQTLSDIQRINVPVKDWIGLGGLVGRVDSLDSLKSTLQGRNWHFVLGAESKGADGKADDLAISGWVSWMRKEGWIGTGAGQTRGDYTYTIGKNRMIVLDTSRLVDVDWLVSELDGAQADKAIERTFVLGWKPLVEPLGFTVDPLVSDFLAEESTKKAAKALTSHDKVVGYFCSSPSVFGLTQLAVGSDRMQVIVGNGGGPLNTSWLASKQASYGFSMVIVYKSGFVGLVPFDRPLPTDESEAAKSATSKGQIRLWSKPVPVKK